MTNSTLVNATRQYDSKTANGAVTHSTSLNKCLDFFFIAGASRNMDSSDIITAFEAARNENVLLAYQIVFWARDVRGGAGERRVFQIIGKHCLVNHKKDWETLSILICEFGSWKDFFVIEDICNDTLNFLSNIMEDTHIPNNQLCAKWFPRKGAWFAAMHKYKGMTPKEFRKYLVANTDVVETKVCSKEWSAIDYSKIPSLAMHKHRKSFTKQDTKRFEAFNQAVLDGKETVNAATLFPYDLYRAINQYEANETAIEAQWKSLPDYMAGSRERILPVCDVSGSMECNYGESTLQPMDISVSLGLYIAERNEGLFRDAFITFSQNPTMEYVVGETLKQKLTSINQSDWGYNTNLQRVFELVLKSAERASIAESEMPTKLLIISDMEFDEACEDGTNLDAMRQQYADSGYTMPEVIFWNVNARLGNIPASQADEKVGMVSGCSPAILTGVLQGKVETPTELMLKVVDCERYKMVSGSLVFFNPENYPPEKYPDQWTTAADGKTVCRY